MLFSPTCSFSFLSRWGANLVLLALVIACSTGGGGGDGTTPNKPAVVPNPPVGKVDDAAGFFVEVLPAVEGAEEFFDMHKGLSTFDEPCKGELGKIVDCYMDAEEWTLNGQGYSFHYHVPSTMCAYVSVDPFYFVNRQTKRTTELTKFTDKNGQIGIDEDRNGEIEPEKSFGCYTEKGEPVCCVGEYVETSFVWDPEFDNGAGLPKGAYGKPETAAVSRTIDKCLGGPATISQPKDKFGIPKRTFEFVKGKGISKEYKFDPTKDHGVGAGWVANYFNPAQHGNKAPAAFDFDIDPGADEEKYGNPYYTITCHDSAWETLAAIRIQIREWNTKSNYSARATEPTKHDELGFESDPWPSEGRNDSLDWLDFQTLGVIHPGFQYQ